MKSRPTIRDVAERASVSTATVSFVLNDNANEVISDKVKKRVWAVARAERSPERRCVRPETQTHAQRCFDLLQGRWRDREPVLFIRRPGRGKKRRSRRATTSVISRSRS
jgi:hypothetical protein